MGSSQSLRIGVFIEKVQLSDITGIDLIGNCATEYIKVAATMGFAHLLPHAIDMEFLYISSTLDPTSMTPCMSVKPPHTYETAPVDLDILVMGGPPFDMRPKASLEYLKKADGRTKVIMSTCVGGLWLADAEILKGKSCTTNRFAIPVARQMHPETEWLDQRRVVDESGKTKYWTAGGAGAGIDMIGTYVRQVFGDVLADAAWDALEFDPTVRGQFYHDPMKDISKGSATAPPSISTQK